MPDGHFDPLPEVQGDDGVTRHGRFIDVEVLGDIVAAGGTYDSITITNATITTATIDDIDVTNANIDSGTMAGLTVDGNITLGTGGVFRTAASGQRIEMAATDFSRISLYTGATNETIEAGIYNTDTAGDPSLTIVGPTHTSFAAGVIEFDPADSSLRLSGAGASGSANTMRLTLSGLTAEPRFTFSGTRQNTTYTVMYGSYDGTDVVLSVNGDVTADSVATAALTYTSGWTSFTPTLIASTTSPTLGSGSSATGRYTVIGNMCVVQIRIVFGSSGTSAGSGTYSVWFASAPAISGSELSLMTIGQGELFESGVAAYNVLARADTSNNDRVTLRFQQSGSSASSPVTDAAPLAWGANDSINVQLVYEIA